MGPIQVQFGCDMGISHRHVEIFHAIMTTGSLTGAAATLRTSQPTLSRDLAQMEWLLGYHLFDRINGRLRPTVRAAALFDEVRRSFVGMDHINAIADSLKAFEHGQLSVICVPGLSHSLMPTVCRRFLAGKRHSCITITPQDSPQLEELLTAQRHDLGITECDTPPAGTCLERLLEAEEVCVLPEGHALAAREVIRPEDLAGEPFVSLAATDSYRIQMDEVFRQHGVERDIIVETHSAVSVCAMVQAGVGVAMVNPLTAHALEGKGLHLRRFSVRIPFHVNLVRPEYRPASPMADRFVAVLAAEVQTLLADLPH
jgi:DNA-binding transcriptional LysR family regulator